MYNFTDSLGYILVGNPVSQAIINTTIGVARSTGVLGKNDVLKATNIATVATVNLPLWRLAGKDYNFIRLAGISGASAVILAALGTHKLIEGDEDKTKVIFSTANRFHFINAFALMAMPLVKRPYVTATLWTGGTLIFSGILYYRALTKSKSYSHLAPMGGICIVLAWLSLVF